MHCAGSGAATDLLKGSDHCEVMLCLGACTLLLVLGQALYQSVAGACVATRLAFVGHVLGLQGLHVSLHIGSTGTTASRVRATGKVQGGFVQVTWHKMEREPQVK